MPGDFAFIFALPEGEAAKAVVPFTWVSLNWNPQRPHPPPRRPGPQRISISTSTSRSGRR